MNNGDSQDNLSPGGWHGRAQNILLALSSSRTFTITVLLYICILFALRITLFPGGSEDDAETLLLSQSLEGGYKPGQPPLYTWLAFSLTQVFGSVLPVVVALKYICLGLIYVLIHRLARLFTDDHLWAVVAGLSVLGIYYLSWDAVLNYSQTVLLAVLAVALLLNVTRIASAASPGLGTYIWLGIIAGAGVMTKYNFAILIVALFAASLLDRDLRQKLLNGKCLVAVLIATVISLPHAVWFLGGGSHAESLSKAVPLSDGGGGINEFVSVRLLALIDMAEAILSILSPLLILLILFFPRAAWRATDSDEARLRWRKLCERTFLVLLALMVIVVLVSGVTEVRNHWFLLLAPFPAYAVLRIAAVYPATSRRVAGFACLLAVLGIAVYAGMTIRAFKESAECDKCKMVVPYEQLADRLQDAGFNGGTIYAYDYPTQVSGNLRPYFPDSRFVSYKFSDYTPPIQDEADGKCIAVWLLNAGAQSPSPNAMLRALATRLDVVTSSGDVMQTVDVSISGRAEPLSYGFILIDDLSRQGNCR